MKKRSSSDKVISNQKDKSRKQRSINQIKYIGMDVLMATTVIAIVNSKGKVLTEAIVETNTSTILDFFKGQRGTLYVTLQEGTQAAWLYDLIRPHVAKVIVCNARKIAKADNRADKIDAKRLAELLRTNALKPVYHGEHSTQAIKELARSYVSLVHDSTRVKNRLKARFRARGIPCKGSSVYSKKDRDQWRERIDNNARRMRIERLRKELENLTEIVKEAEADLIQESRKHAAVKILPEAWV